MSLRKAPQLTPQLLAAARRNAHRSTGPRSPAAKRNSKLNALKHGAYVCAENQRESMQALGEDPERFEALVEELRGACAGGDALLEKQVEDLAWLYWRRERLERALAGLNRRALQGLEERQQRRRQEMARVTFEASRHELLEWQVEAPSNDRGVELRLKLSYLGVILEEVRRGLHRSCQHQVLESIYGGERGWRMKSIYALVYRFCVAEGLEGEIAARVQELDLEREKGEWQQPPGEAQQQELLGLLEEEIASVEEELGYEEKANEERVAIEREACLAPQEEMWCMLLRQEGALDRSIDRKVRILLQLRKETGGGDGGGQSRSVEEPADSTVPEIAELVEAASNKKLRERRGNVDEKKGPDFVNRVERGISQTGGSIPILASDARSSEVTHM